MLRQCSGVPLIRHSTDKVKEVLRYWRRADLPLREHCDTNGAMGQHPWRHRAQLGARLRARTHACAKPPAVTHTSPRLLPRLQAAQYGQRLSKDVAPLTTSKVQMRKTIPVAKTPVSGKNPIAHLLVPLRDGVVDFWEVAAQLSDRFQNSCTVWSIKLSCCASVELLDCTLVSVSSHGRIAVVAVEAIDSLGYAGLCRSHS